MSSWDSVNFPDFVRRTYRLSFECGSINSRCAALGGIECPPFSHDRTYTVEEILAKSLGTLGRVALFVR